MAVAWTRMSMETVSKEGPGNSLRAENMGFADGQKWSVRKKGGFKCSLHGFWTGDLENGMAISRDRESCKGRSVFNYLFFLIARVAVIEERRYRVWMYFGLLDI